MNQHLLLLNQLTKRYKNHLAVDAVNLSVPRMSSYGLLGPNGAGKTTIIRMITSIIKPDAGHITLDNEPMTRAHIRAIGYMPEERGLYKKMKVGQQLLYLAQLKGLSKSDAYKAVTSWMERFNIMDWWQKKIQELSKGMQQKVQFIATVVHDPKLIILDEPFSGLDPINTQLIQSEIDRLKALGATIIFSTHRMEQVEEICEYIGLINQGKIILEGRLGDIKNKYKKNMYKLEFEGVSPVEFLQDFELLDIKEQSIKIRISKDRGLNRILKILSDYPGRVRSFEEVLPTLNDVFIRSVKNNTSAYE